MIDIGVPSYLVSSSVIAILAQRLVRVVCSKCKQPYRPTDEELEVAGITPEQAANATFMKGKGCSHCQKKGYRGRLGVFELMLLTSKIRSLTFEGAATQDIRKQAIREGMSTLYDDGIQKALNGVTTLEEVFRVTKQSQE